MSTTTLRHPLNKPVIQGHARSPVVFKGSPSGYGATFIQNQTQFKVWAPTAQKVDLLVLSPTKTKVSDTSWHALSDGTELNSRIRASIPMKKDGVGNFNLTTSNAPPGTLYMYRLDYGDNISKPLPDPYSEAQPEDVYGPSMVVNDQSFKWTDQHWQTPPDFRQLNLYRLHIGTWTPKGTLKSAKARLEYLKKQGFNAVELFPITEFPGKKNWGYDPAELYAVENTYGKPDDLKAFVNEAHRQGVAVLLDGVYNHLSPEGQYLNYFDQHFMSHKPTRWGPSVNWENPMVRQFINDNIRFWIDRYHIDGFRLDHTPGIPENALRKIVKSARAANPKAILIAEDTRNWNSITAASTQSIQEPDGTPPKRGFNCTAQWDFSYHHNLQSLMTGDPYKHGVTTVDDWVRSITRSKISLLKAVHYDQSHDEIANDNDGQRNVNLMGGPRNGAQKAMMASVIKFLLPGIPLTFMGQEYAERNPFRYFSSSVMNRYNITQNRPEGEDSVNGQGFRDSILTSTSAAPKHLRLTEDISRLRNQLSALWQGDKEEMNLTVHPNKHSVAVLHRLGKENPGDQVFALINFSDENYTDANGLVASLPKGNWTEVMHTADKKYGGNGKTNSHQTLSQGQHFINLPPWSISIWHSNHQNTWIPTFLLNGFNKITQPIRQLFLYIQKFFTEIINRIHN